MDSSDKAIRTNDRKSNTSREPESLFPANPSSTLSPNLARPSKEANRRQASKIFDDHSTTAGYESVPLIDIDTLPRGGISFETKAVGRIQFGIPPETIKDSMLLGMEVPTVYIVPVERFCRELGPALGLNLAEFEFPAYFNYFVRGKRVVLVVDSTDAERDIRNVFGETLLGPEQFRNHEDPCPNVDDDFDPSFPKDMRPNFYKEFKNFRTAEKSGNLDELRIDTLLEFVHFRSDRQSSRESDFSSAKIGVPPSPPEFLMTTVERQTTDWMDACGSEMPMTSLRRFSTSGAGQKRLSHTTLRPRLNEESIDDDALVLNKEPDRRGSLRRTNSDSSTSNRSQSSRKSIRGESEATPGDRTERDEPFPKHPSRRSSLPTGEQSIRMSATASGMRDSLISLDSCLTGDGTRSRYSRLSRKMSTGSSILAYGYDFMDDGDDLQDSHWMYSQAKWLGEVATVYPPTATEDEKRTNSTARVEIFKMAGGTEYIVHDVDKNNIIVGKTRISGTVRAPDELSLTGFISPDVVLNNNIGDDKNDDGMEEEDNSTHQKRGINLECRAKTFHPPSFGVTVLGNSHGFDKNGATSGYVLWVNGRGIMVDPPPFSSSTLEREGIRPQMIIAIIITHCHADHDAGAFQKIMTGARVAIITTPTIYQSFIRKYSALSGLRPTLLRHSHRHRPAIIGQPLMFQGAVFHFTYTLHTIPCISFKVVWRGRSIVFTGDHMNIPEEIDLLEERGVLSRGRANDLRELPIQDCDVLLHEAGAPPIHTPLRVLQELPDHVKARLYVVHTAAIPPDSGLRVAPTGTGGTIRLDGGMLINSPKIGSINSMHDRSRNDDSGAPLSVESLQDGASQSLSVLGDLNPTVINSLVDRFSGDNGKSRLVPLALLRPTDVSDAWFILNLLSAVPFLSSLSYAHTMEVLEIADVEVFCAGEVVIGGQRRPDILCVFWEGTCAERINTADGAATETSPPIVWHAGDWTGPLSLQPDVDRSARMVPGEQPRDIVAISKEGVKVIVLSMNDVTRILKMGSKLFRKYMSLEEREPRDSDQAQISNGFEQKPPKVENAADSIMDALECNSVLGSLYPMQKRHFESLAEGPRFFACQSLLWKVGDPVNYAFVILQGTATFGKKPQRVRQVPMGRRGSTGAISLGLTSIDEQGRDRQQVSPIVQVDADRLLPKVHPNSEYARLESVLQIRMEEMEDRMDSRTSIIGTSSAHRDRFANKVLGRLYARHAYTEHLVFSRGNFLCDTSRMVSGDLATIHTAGGFQGGTRSSIASTVGDHHCHTSNLMAGPDGCVVMVFPRSTLVPFLDNNPGVLLCLLGTKVVV